MKLRTRNTLENTLAALPVIALATGLAMLPFAAKAAPANYEMVVFEDSRHAGKVMSGEYDTTRAGLAALEATGAETFDVLNNLCVAYTLTKRFDKAEAACDAAVETDVTPGVGIRKSLLRDREAVALSNRGVLRAVTGDVIGAKEDFERAAAISDVIDAAEINLTRLSALAPAPADIARAER